MPPPGAKHDIPHKSDSDDEDEDYVPPEGQDSDSETSEEENIAEGGVAAVNTGNPVDEETKKREREALWSSFQASVANPSNRPDAGAQPKKLVKIERRFRFAGEEIVEVVEVPEDSPDAKKWPLLKDPASDEKVVPANLQADARTCIVHEPVSLSASTSSAAETTQESSGVATGVPSAATSKAGTATSISTQATGTKPLLKKPGPRKSKTTLGPIPGPAKAKKLSTLDKSAMDWKKHLDEAGSSVTDELEANRRAGGFLEKVEFLKRVEDRKEEQLDALKSNKRRKL